MSNTVPDYNYWINPELSRVTQVTPMTTPETFPAVVPAPTGFYPSELSATVAPDALSEPPSDEVPPYSRQAEVSARHTAFLKAQEVLHTRHFETQAERLEAEFRLADWLLA